MPMSEKGYAQRMETQRNDAAVIRLAASREGAAARA
jgi:hypothetical protein